MYYDLVLLALDLLQLCITSVHKRHHLRSLFQKFVFITFICNSQSFQFVL